MSLGAAIWADTLHGATIFKFLDLGATFHFPTDPTKTLHTKVGGKSFVSSKNGMTFKTGPNTAVVAS